MDAGPPLSVKVWGEFACFTRPEMKVERVTYPVMTPSAARGVLESIFWKPECAWRVREIWVLKDIRYFSILRNEVKKRASFDEARKWSRDGGGFDASDPDNGRAQRHTLALRNVAYVIRADLVPITGESSDAAKYRDQFRRRVERGQCFLQPYLGCREFAAAFGPPGPGDEPIERSADLGPMLLDIVYDRDASGRGEPRFFDARLDMGVLRVGEAIRTAGGATR